MTRPISESIEKPYNGTSGLFVPLFLIAIALLGATAIPTLRLVSERQVLKDTDSEQATPLANTYKLRVAADSLFSKTQVLADKGNPSAMQVVEVLKQRGLTINPNAQTPAPPP